MKKVVLPEKFVPCEIVSLDTVSENKYYGFCFNRGKEKGFVAQSRYKDGVYVMLSKDNFTYGNQWSAPHAPQWDSKERGFRSLKGAFEWVLRVGADVYEFNRPQDLFQWLMQD